MKFWKLAISKLKYGLLALFLMTIFSVGTCSATNDDLLWQIMEPSYLANTTIHIGKSAKRVGNEVLEGSFDVSFKIEKQVKRGEDGKPLCRGGQCSSVCQEYNESNEDQCKSEWQYDIIEVQVGKEPSMIVKITKILLSLVVALSVTMILYNGLMYIVQTGQGKENKDLVKNLVYIVIGILLSLFSVTIITLLQSVSTTLDKETTEDRRLTIDENAVEP